MTMVHGRWSPLLILTVPVYELKQQFLCAHKADQGTHSLQHLSYRICLAWPRSGQSRLTVSASMQSAVCSWQAHPCVPRHAVPHYSDPPRIVLRSRKGQELEASGKASFCVYWERMQRQVSAEPSPVGQKGVKLMPTLPGRHNFVSQCC